MKKIRNRFQEDDIWKFVSSDTVRKMAKALEHSFSRRDAEYAAGEVVLLLSAVREEMFRNLMLGESPLEEGDLENVFDLVKESLLQDGLYSKMHQEN